MAKTSKYQLSEAEVQQLERAMHNDGRVEVAQRATAIRQLHLGAKPQAVAEAFAVSLATIYRWWKNWRAGGIEGLSNSPKQGRPPKADEAYWQQLDQILEQAPQELGYVFVVWTTARLRDHMEKISGVRLSVEWLRVQMKKRGYVYRRPKGDLRALQDPEARAEAEILLERLKKAQWTEKSSYSLWTKVQ